MIIEISIAFKLPQGLLKYKVDPECESHHKEHESVVDKRCIARQEGHQGFVFVILLTLVGEEDDHCTPGKNKYQSSEVILPHPFLTK